MDIWSVISFLLLQTVLQSIFLFIYYMFIYKYQLIFDNIAVEQISSGEMLCQVCAFKNVIYVSKFPLKGLKNCTELNQ